ncbi:KH domain-containing protein [Candidatus Saccharibacteria bacterium]|nr:KH domain-containing protein [Candidatus Saccharibacteria bacterium]
MATIDQQFVEYIVKTLVNNPDKVAVERKIDEKGVLLSLTVDPEDVGRVIGKRGVTAQAIRVLLRALGTKQDARFNLKIVNTDEGGEERPAKPAEKPAEVEETAVEEVVEEEEPAETSELAEKTRAELADLDDLDI